MRRKEFAVTKQDEEQMAAFLQEMNFGFLGTVDEEGQPGVTPLNYVFNNGTIYFHGSHIGEKMKRLRHNPRVSFSVAKEYAIIPSYFSDPEMACPATSYFKSVRIDGRAVVVDNLEEKAAVLEALMKKLQPEGGYRTIDAKDQAYIPRLKGVAVVRIEAERMSGKFKFGQNLNNARRQAVENGLADRGRPLDLDTMELMRKFCPAHRES
ncbi:pyridoxamine 5'-phosphate oxidase family protein [Paenibacillus sp. GCM10027626]|uniref:pyridoxamine 5'-phosphate oxidase family protein n=1 Tax=Paenibacillus sp. GCM10027626 TaxID=3273411 RepID=UPI00362AF6E6